MILKYATDHKNLYKSMIRTLAKCFGNQGAASLTRGFAFKSDYDLAVIGGGPGGILSHFYTS